MVPEVDDVVGLEWNWRICLAGKFLRNTDVMGWPPHFWAILGVTGQCPMLSFNSRD